MDTPLSCPAITEPSTDWHRPMLRELAELAMDAARSAHAALPAASSDQPEAAASGLLFTRLARVVRQTIALDARLATADRDRTSGDATARARQARAEARRHALRRANLRRRLAQTIRDTADPSDAESLLADLDDRLDDDDIRAALEHTPAIRIICSLCEELGITPDLANWSDEELAIATQHDPEDDTNYDAGSDPPRRPGPT